jgi:hypothetical protein
MDENKNLAPENQENPSAEADNHTQEPPEEKQEEKVYEGTVVDVPPTHTQDREEDEEEIPPPRVYTQHKGLQIALGIISAIAMWALLLVSGITTDGVLQWAWVILFAAVMLGRKQIEKKHNVVFRIYSLALLIAMVVCLVAAIIIYIAFPSILPEAFFSARQ